MVGLVRFLARTLLGTTFIVLGWDAAREPGGRVGMAANLGVPQPALAVRVNAYTMIAAGITLVLDVLPRLSAAALAASLIPTTAAGHHFWKKTDPQKRNGQRIHFLKNLSMIGGLLTVALEPSAEKTDK
ncbi:MAG: DoxX family protein [Thermomicrobiales bacterium]